MIVVDNLSKSYGSQWAIHNISFSIKRGEAVGLLGLNGAGKSTILKIIGTLMVPSGGTAHVGGFSVTEDPHQVRKIIGYLPDTPPLYNEMTTRSYLNFVAQLKEVSQNNLKKFVDEAMERTNLGPVADSHLSTLSHGYRQRVGIAQALVHKPQVLVLDEPINGLDPVQIVDMRDMIKDLKGDYTLVLSSHILSEITKTCDRMIIVDHGKLVAEGSEASLKEKATKGMKINLEVSHPKSLIAKIEQLPEVISVVESKFEDTAGLVIDTNADIRAQLAKLVVGEGLDLLGMQRTFEGLEGVFMKVIQNSEVAKR